MVQAAWWGYPYPDCFEIMKIWERPITNNNSTILSCTTFDQFICLFWRQDLFVILTWLDNLLGACITGCCKTTGKVWKHITETLYGVFLVFLGSYDCQIWGIFHFGTLWAYGWKKRWKISPWKKATFQGWLKLAYFLIS